jgi:hypothetical protein
MKKAIVRLIIALLAIIIVCVVVVGLFLDSAIKKGVETVGPKIAKVDIKLDGISLSLLSGSGKIKGLVVGNPEGCKTPQAISVGVASAAVKIGSILSDKVVVSSVRVEAPEITFEGGLGGNNLSKILDNVNATVGGSTTNKSAAKEEQPGKKIEVDDFLITGAKVHLSITGMAGKSVPIVLPDIHLTDLGKDSNGLTPAELTKKVLEAVVASTTKAASQAIADLGKGATDAAKGAAGKAGGAVKGIGDLFKKKQ